MPDAMIGKQLVSAKFVMYSAIVLGRVSLLAFVLFLYKGAISLAQLNLSPAGWLAWDTLLSLLFFIQHSTMVRRSLRARMAKRIPGHYHGAVFTLASSTVLVLVVVFWQSSDLLLIELHPPLRWLARVLFIAAAAGIGWGVWALKGFDPFGVGAIRAKLTGQPVRTHAFTIKGPYLWVRHPLYFFVLVMIWACPHVTADRLLFNLLWSGWIYVGAVFEEKDLLSEFGDKYYKYQRQVPMLIPWKGFKGSDKTKNT